MKINRRQLLAGSASLGALATLTGMQMSPLFAAETASSDTTFTLSF